MSKSFFICIIIFVLQVWKFAKCFRLDSWIEGCVWVCAECVFLSATGSGCFRDLSSSHRVFMLWKWQHKDPWWHLYTLCAGWIFFKPSSNRLIINEAECSRRSAWYDGCHSDSYWERYWDMYAWHHRSFVLTSQTQLSSHMLTGLLSANHVLAPVKTASKQSNILNSLNYSSVSFWGDFYLDVLTICIL